MITGFNTDIEFQGTTYHVQTEDKGVDTPLILSLVYDRGTILASKRSPYDDLLAEVFDEKLLIDRLQKQHKLMCAAVRAGRIEDLKRMTMKDSALRQQGLVAQKEIKTPVEEKKINFPPAKPGSARTEKMPPPILNQNLPVAKQGQEVTLDSTNSEISEKAKLPPAKLKDELIWDIPIDIVEEHFIEAIRVIEEEIILPAEAVEIIVDTGQVEQFIDFTLKAELLNEIIFKGGERKTVSLLVYRGNRETGLSGAQIIVKIIGTSFRPLIFHAKTDSNGVATVHLQLPHFKTGRAAVLIRAMSEGDETELRRVIEQG